MNEGIYFPKSVTTKKFSFKRTWWFPVIGLALVNTCVFTYQALVSTDTTFITTSGVWALLTLIIAIKGVLTVTE